MVVGSMVAPVVMECSDVAEADNDDNYTADYFNDADNDYDDQ